MIDHIEAYLKQHYCRDYFNSYGETVEDDHYFMYLEEVDGLIESIVRECVAIGDNYEDILGNEPECFNCRKVAYGIVDKIKQHFGIE